MPYAQRMRRFRDALGTGADFAFLPLSADLQYLTGFPRDIPNFGRTIHPGEWAEGLWVSPNKPAVMILARMTAEFGAVGDTSEATLRILGDFDDPVALVRDVLRSFELSGRARAAVSDTARSETMIVIQELVQGVRFVSASNLIARQRVVKSEDEIDIMRHAGEITEAAYGAVLERLRHGMTELDLIEEINYQLKAHGALGPSFTTALYNTGPGMPLNFNRLETWPRQLNPPCCVLFDFGAIFEGYCYDYGRTVAFGAPPAQFRIAHSLVMEAQSAGIAALQAGAATCEQVDAAARTVIAGSGYGEAFRHRLGHSIGLDVHEPPFLTQGDATPLREGMLFTVEPSILIDSGYSARVEDVVVARPDGGEKLTNGYQDLYVVD